MATAASGHAELPFIADFNPTFCTAPRSLETASRTLGGISFHKRSLETPELDKQIKFIPKIVMNILSCKGAHKDAMESNS